MISRMVEILADMIKPAAPTQRTVGLVTGNAKNWGHTTCLILTEHYEQGIEDLLEELAGLLTPGWEAAFEVAVRWATRNLPRITQDVIDQAEALVTARTGTRDTVQGHAPRQVPPQADPPQAVEAATVQTRVPQRERDPPRPVEAATVRTRAPQEPLVRNSVATMTDPGEQRPDWDLSALEEDSPLARRETQRVPRGARGQPSTGGNLLQDVVLEESGELEVLLAPTLTPTHAALIDLFDEMQAEEDRARAEAQSLQPPVQTTALVHQGAGLDEDEDLFEESFNYFSSPQPQRFRANRHPNTQRKLTDWDLVVHKKWVFMGDSNLSNLPEFFNKDLQVESFPGAHFRHGQALLEKTVPPNDVEVEKLVLSFGINSRGNKSKETTVKNVQGAIRAAKRKFPYSEIWIPLVNFSRDLPAEERGNLQELNDHIMRNMPFIPLLPEADFVTEVDDIHWTKETGMAIFEHWMRVLNSNTP